MDTKEINQRAARIKLLVLDVDGVLTGGQVVYDQQGNEIKFFNVRDGHGIKLLMRAGVQVVWLSGRGSPANRRRAEELGISQLHENIKIKLPVLQEVVEQLGMPWEQVAYMGDDLIDLPCLRTVGLSLAPADAIEEVKAEVHWVASLGGGRGAVRQAVELILKSSGAWQQVTSRYY